MRLQLVISAEARNPVLIDSKGPSRVFRSVGGSIYRRRSHSLCSESWEPTTRVPAPVRALVATAGARRIEWTPKTKTARILPEY